VPSFFIILLAIAVLSGATASVVGFGIGSLLTPMLATAIGMDLAVAAVALPHAVATALRCWRLRKSIDWSVLKRFGLLSAVGGLAGALAYARLDPDQLSRVLGALLLLTAIAQFTGLAARWRPRGPAVALLGLGSGFFGGIAGNQGGLRAAALTAFDLSPLAFVATSTATGLLVDAARAPVYLLVTGRTLLALWLPISLASLGVVVGTILGERILLGLSRRTFGMIMAAAIGLLGVWLLLR
jgi:uncharacterized membrane protein YfcA